MQSVTQILNDLIADADSFDELKQSVFDSHGYWINGVYCLHTGKLIGRFEREEIEEAIFEEGGADQDSDVLGDALILRCVTSMRPSPALNMPDTGTIREMVARRPVDALAFLLNRLYGNRQLIKLGREAAFQPLFARIATHSACKRLAESGADLKPYIHWLLELDSKFNLHDLTPPAFMPNPKARDQWIVDSTGYAIPHLIDKPNFLPAFEAWVFARLSDAAMRDSARQREATWFRGNQMTGKAYLNSWLENPEAVQRKESALNKERQARDRRKAAAKPGRPPSERTQKLNAKVAGFMDLLDGILEKAGQQETPKAAPKPSVLRASGLFKKKES